MAIPGTLPQRVFLLAYHPDKGKVPMGSNLGAMLRAAALAALYLDGHLTDDRGRAVIDVRRPGHDPVLDALLDEIAASKPRRWQSWVDHHQRATIGAVRRQLHDGGWIRLEHHRILGLFPTATVTIRDPRVRKELLGRVNGALKDPIGRIDSADAALVAIVAAANLKPVLDRETRRAGYRRIRQLTAVSGPIAPALLNSIRDSALGEV